VRRGFHGVGIDPLDPRPHAAGALVEGDRKIQGVTMVEPEVRPAWLSDG